MCQHEENKGTTISCNQCNYDIELNTRTWMRMRYRSAILEGQNIEGLRLKSPFLSGTRLCPPELLTTFMAGKGLITCQLARQASMNREFQQGQI